MDRRGSIDIRSQSTHPWHRRPVEFLKKLKSSRVNHVSWNPRSKVFLLNPQLGGFNRFEAIWLSLLWPIIPGVTGLYFITCLGLCYYVRFFSKHLCVCAFRLDKVQGPQFWEFQCIIITLHTVYTSKSPGACTSWMIWFSMVSMKGNIKKGQFSGATAIYCNQCHLSIQFEQQELPVRTVFLLCSEKGIKPIRDFLYW